MSLAQWTPAHRTQKLLGSQPLGLVPLPLPLREHWPAQVWRVAKAAHTTPCSTTAHEIYNGLYLVHPEILCVRKKKHFNKHSKYKYRTYITLSLSSLLFHESCLNISSIWTMPGRTWNCRWSACAIQQTWYLLVCNFATRKLWGTGQASHRSLRQSGCELVKLDITWFSYCLPSNKNYIVPIVPQRPLKKSASLISYPVCIRKQSLHLRKGHVFWYGVFFDEPYGNPLSDGYLITSTQQPSTSAANTGQLHCRRASLSSRSASSKHIVAFCM